MKNVKKQEVEKNQQKEKFEMYIIHNALWKVWITHNSVLRDSHRDNHRDSHCDCYCDVTVTVTQILSVL